MIVRYKNKDRVKIGISEKEVNMDKKEWIFVISIIVIVAFVASVISVTLTGNVVKVSTTNNKKAPEVYTKTEIDSLVKNLSRGCQYVGYKDAIPNGNGTIAGKTIWKACELYGLTAKMTTRYELNILYNYQDCSPSYQMFASASHLFGRAGSADVLGGNPIITCSNAKFPNNSSNGGFSEENSWFYDGVICC